MDESKRQHGLLPIKTANSEKSSDLASKEGNSSKTNRILKRLADEKACPTRSMVCGLTKNDLRWCNT
jgi:hypothetical protein